MMALVSVLCSNSITYYAWLFETDHISYKICDPLDGETEYETEEDKDNKVQTIDFDFAMAYSQPLENSDYIKFCKSIYHLDIPTPPPRVIS